MVVYFPHLHSYADLAECLLRKALMVQCGWSFKDALRVIPDGILDKAVGLIIPNVRAKRKAMVPLPSYNAVNTADIQQATASRCANFTSRLVGERLANLALRMGLQGYTLRVSPIDVQMAQRGASVVPTLQSIAKERGILFTQSVGCLEISAFLFFFFMPWFLSLFCWHEPNVSSLVAHSPDEKWPVTFGDGLRAAYMANVPAHSLEVTDASLKKWSEKPPTVYPSIS